MSVIRQYSMNGLMKQAITVPAGVVSGGLDYAGNGYFIVGADRGIQLIKFVNKSINAVKTLFTYRAAESGKGACVNRGKFWDGNGIYHTFTETSGSPSVTSFWFGHISMKTLKNRDTNQVSSIGLFMGGPDTDGLHVHIMFTSSTIPAQRRWRMYRYDGSTFQIAKSYTVSSTPKDIAWDGHNWWAIEGDASIAQYKIFGSSISVRKTFTPSGTGLTGIACNGRDLFVSSST